MCEPQFATAKDRYDYIKQQVDAAAAAQLAYDQNHLQIAFVRWQDRDCTPHGSRHAEYVDDGRFVVTATAGDPIVPSLDELCADARARGYHVEEDSIGGTTTAVVYCPHALAASRARPVDLWPRSLTATVLWADKFGINPCRHVYGHAGPTSRTHQAAVAVYRAARVILAADVCSQVVCREAGAAHAYILNAFGKEMQRAGVEFTVSVDKMTMRFGDARCAAADQITVTLNCLDFVHPDKRT